MMTKPDIGDEVDINYLEVASPKAQAKDRSEVQSYPEDVSSLTLGPGAKKAYLP